MSDIAIKVENLSKLYKIGARQQGYKTLRESIMGTLTAPFQRLKKSAKPTTLNRQSTIDNPTPSGPSRMSPLKSSKVKSSASSVVMARARPHCLRFFHGSPSPPRVGQRYIGRIGSLLEVGTGFHPELTGREDIYLNGAILGMKKVEIDRKFDKIVDFACPVKCEAYFTGAEIPKFIDTLVKRYYSGMYVSLAFAVGAHLEPEILLVDEVLAMQGVASYWEYFGKT